MLNIIADENILFAREAFSHIGNVELADGRKISNSMLKNKDILLVRSVTKVDKALMSNSNIKFVGTATIGSDHIDKSYLTTNNIFFTDAAGCNSDAVAEYVFTAIFELLKNDLKIERKTIGIIGHGNIGSRVAKLSKALGFKVLINDPPLKRINHNLEVSELDELMNADIITLHVPLNIGGPDNTYHLFDYNNLEKLKDGAILINASRGQVVDNKALQKIIDIKNLKIILDVWENEPHINTSLLKKVEIATPHIAGYSYEGKVNGTVMIYNSLCKFLNIKPEWKPPQKQLKDLTLTGMISSNEDLLYKIFTKIYPIANDDSDFRKIIYMMESKQANYFDQLRKNYQLREAFLNFKINSKNINQDLLNILTKYRFNIET